jgi:tetratricopeptide (TPR) repeat protein/NAD-dependent SIR2 family protein deacetylase
MKTNDLLNNLPDKRRTFSELIRFIDTRNETSASYSVFLGAGASISSGIRTGSQLVDVWRKEQYLKHNTEHTGEYDAGNAKEWLTTHELRWYSPQKEYSSLFEKTFDLATQRRIFVEKEVVKGFPSLGYSYLVRLIEENYFNTIFTTNFDDMMNEAFHQFSEVRPIVCAHDSSIKSVTFTSKRPKIIKLHGDYLFDDIKSTLRETETLEKNTRDKFIELSKEQGLIVVGYSGTDRSIMDVLDFLLKDDAYLKNGIYWCVRSEDRISEELYQLLWKDRVFWVEIDGFDEFFASLYDGLVDPPSLPVDTSLFNKHTAKIYDKYLTNEFLTNSKSHIVVNHLNRLEKERNSNNLASLFKSLTSSEDESADAKIDDESITTQEDIQTILQVQTLQKERKFKEVLSFVEGKISSSSKKDIKVRLLSEAYDAARQIYDNRKAIEICDHLIDLEPKNARHYRYKALVVDDFDNKIQILDDAIEIDPYSALSYLRKAKILFKKSDVIIGNEKESAIDQAAHCVEKSIECDPSIDNEAWGSKFTYVKKSGSKNKDDELLKIINSLRKQSAYSPNVSRLILDYCEFKKTRVYEGTDILTVLSNSRENYFPEDDLDHYLLLVEACKTFNEKEFFESIILKLDEIPEIRKRARYIKLKADLTANLLGNIPEAIRILRQHPNFEKNDDIILDYLDYLIADEQLENASASIARYSSQLNPEKIIDRKIELLDLLDKPGEAISLVSSKKQTKYSKYERAMELSYLFLREGNFKKSREIARTFLDEVHYNINFDILILNYEFASSKAVGHKIDKTKISQILNNSPSELVEAVSRLLLGESATSLEIFKKYLSKNFMMATKILKYPIVQSIKEDIQRMKVSLLAK